MEERAYAACGYAPFAGCAWAGTVAALGGGSALNAGALIEDETYWANEWGGCGARWRPAAMARCAAAALARLGVDAAPPPDPRSDVFVGACGAAGLDDAFRPRLAFDRRGRRCGAWRLLPADDARLRVVHGEALRILTAAGRATGVVLGLSPKPGGWLKVRPLTDKDGARVSEAAAALGRASLKKQVRAPVWHAGPRGTPGPSCTHTASIGKRHFISAPARGTRLRSLSALGHSSRPVLGQPDAGPRQAASWLGHSEPPDRSAARRGPSHSAAR